MEHGSLRRCALGGLGPPCRGAAPTAPLLERASRGTGLDASVGERMAQVRVHARRAHGTQSQDTIRVEVTLRPGRQSTIAVWRDGGSQILV